ncbi:hypothetical protein K493DRAFT_316770 [Basidiobolus meristosporus CBS 931.73]|uniref:PSI domain-containing protein n=1 Tax=Basidiobolus meristosporus CBS 931.73 TaxID=1314790 RepID=A0A1Y1Y2C5_9FUNG|nr:hypothetical protein K493DRAFT_316770 [Basidiobolus meristosporus CBS 931.73]|eukprot:ORX92138.1 hypothetical protein K493DRAFT_316770 [Basidiobolus meristosporus CBS 931.73]
MLTLCKLFYSLLIPTFVVTANITNSVIQDPCSAFTDCSACGTISGCGFCTKSHKCIQGSWFEPSNEAECTTEDYLYGQCYVPNVHILSIAIFILGGLLGLTTLYIVYLLLSHWFSTDEEKIYLLSRSSRRISFSTPWTFDEEGGNVNPDSAWTRILGVGSRLKQKYKSVDENSIETGSTSSSIINPSENEPWEAGRKQELIEHYINPSYQRRT